MRHSEAIKHLQRVLQIKQAQEDRLQALYGPAVPRSKRVFDQKTIAALQAVIPQPNTTTTNGTTNRKPRAPLQA